MATESSLNPVPVLVHLLGIALGIYLGLQAMAAIAPDLPAEGVGPGVATSAVPAAVAGADPDSLFRIENLTPALAQLSEQLPAGEGIRRLRIEPGSLSAESADAPGLFALDDVSPLHVEALAAEIERERSRVTLEDIGYMELVATSRGPRWHVQLDVRTTDVSPPWTYGAPIEGSPLTVGPTPPRALGGAR